VQSPAPAAPAGEAPRLARCDALIARLEDWFNLAAALCIFALMFLGMAQVLGRKLFNAPMSGYIDFVELSMATFAFLGIAYCQRVGGHVRMEMILKLAKGRLHWAMELTGTALALAIVTVLIYYGYTHFLRAWQLGDSTIDAELPVWPSKLLVPIAFSLLWLRLALQLWGFARLVRHPEAQEVAVPEIMTAEKLAAKEIEDSMEKR